MTQLKPQSGIMDIALYVGGKSHLDGVKNVLKLSSNENPLGPPPSAVAALQREATQMHRYPSTDHAGLRAAIGRVHGLDPDRIICGVGSDEILTFACQCYAGEGDEVIYTEHGFSMYKIIALGTGATPVVVPETDRVVDVDHILSAITDRTRVIFVTNPGNPTGTLLPDDEVRRLAENVPSHILLVLDGAYTEYVAGFDGGIAMADACPNVLMTRTFSKLYGLGGLRVGWGYASRDVIDVLNRLRGPFNLSLPALAAAEAAVLDRDFAAMCHDDNAKWRDWLATELTALGIDQDPSHTNFILARFADADAAQAADQYLQRKGIIVRAVTGYGFPEGLRITIGDEAGCRRLIAALIEFKEGRT